MRRARLVSNMASLYTLSDPISGAVRYVGCTTNAVEYRLRQHISKSKRGKWPVAQWIRSMRESGLLPLISEVGVFSKEEIEDEEKNLIAKLRLEGADLLNVTSGGKRAFKVAEEFKRNYRGAFHRRYGVRFTHRAITGKPANDNTAFAP